MDNELCTLSEAVFEITEWGNTGFYLCYEWDVNGYRTGEKVIEYQSLIDTEDAEKHIIHPIYTSDYLFEQIERRIGDGKVLHVYSMYDTETYEKYCKANVGTPGTIEIQTERTKTPIKALLKLTLALHEAGELK